MKTTKTRVSKTRISKIRPPRKGRFLLDLACGKRKKVEDGENWIGIDQHRLEGVDHCLDLLKFPWPIDSNIVDEITSSHFVEHIPSRLRGAFMAECYRILKPGAKFFILCPYYTSIRATQDFTHEWPPISEASFFYFNKKWRDENHLDYGVYDIQCDFDFSWSYAGIDNDLATKHDDHKYFGLKHYLNATADLHVTLIKRDPNE